MPKKPLVPSVTQSRGKAYCRVFGEQVYLGPLSDKQRVLRRYAGVILRLSEGIDVNPVRGSSRHWTIDELVVAYLDHAHDYYVYRDPRSNRLRRTSEYANVRSAALVLSELFGDLPPTAFGPVNFKSYRDTLADRDYARSTISGMMARIRRLYRWACHMEYVPGGMYERLRTVPGLRRGERNVRETEPVRAATQEQIDALLPFLSPTVSAMVRVQWHCGMRPSEACILRPCDIDRSQDIWIYRPQRHKNEWRGHALIKAIPKSVQPLIDEWLPESPDGYFFRPAEAKAWARNKAQAGRERKTPRYPSEARRLAREKAKRQSQSSRTQPYYNTDSYRQALDHGFENARQAGVAIDRFTPNQLRHSSISYIAELLGDSAAQRFAGHENAKTTEIYTREQRQIARLTEIALQLDARLAG